MRPDRIEYFDPTGIEQTPSKPLANTIGVFRGPACRFAYHTGSVWSRDHPTERKCIPIDDSVAADRNLTPSLENLEECPLGKNRKAGLFVIQDGDRGHGRRVVSPTDDRDHPLAHCRQDERRIQSLRNAGRMTEAFETRNRQNDPIEGPGLELSQPCVDVPPQIVHPEIGIAGKNLCAPAETAGSDTGGWGHFRKGTTIGDKRIAGVRTRKDGRDHKTFGQLEWNVLQAVNCKIDVVTEKRLIQLFGEEALSANRGHGAVNNAIARRLKGFELDLEIIIGRFELSLHPVRLPERQ